MLADSLGRKSQERNDRQIEKSRSDGISSRSIPAVSDTYAVVSRLSLFWMNTHLGLASENVDSRRFAVQVRQSLKDKVFSEQLPQYVTE